MRPKQPPVSEPGPREAFRYIFSVVLDAIKGGLDGFNIAQRYLGAGLKAVSPTANGEAYKAGVDFGVAASLAQIDAADTAAAGTLNTVARIDHQHAVNTAAAGVLSTISAGATALAGTELNLVRGDHRHPVNTAEVGDLADVGSANAAGTGDEIPRGNHVHKGVHSIGKSGAGYLFGDVTFSEGTGISLTQAAQNIAIASAILAVPAGVILPYGGTSAPTGYLFCDGTSYLRADYAALYAAIGNAFGTADGTHFNVPDLRGRFLRGQDEATGRDPDAAGRTAMAAGGNATDNVGSVQPTATVLPSAAFVIGSGGNHQHAAAGSHQHESTLLGTGNFGVGGTYTMVYGAGSSSAACDLTNSGGSHQHAAGGAHAHAISGGDNETRPINAYVRYIIKT